MNTNPSKQRQQFYRDYASGQWSMSELLTRLNARAYPRVKIALHLSLEQSLRINTLLGVLP
jgi:hypothetical protein